MTKEFHSGFVSISGRPNVGKSTLLNRLVGEKLSITSHKPQTTRNRVQGALTTADAQIIFVDTPGIHRPKHKLGEMMVKEAERGFADADVALFLVSAPDGLTRHDRDILSSRRGRKDMPVFLVVNKIDAVDKTEILETTRLANELFPFAETIPISAVKGTNIDTLLELLIKALPIGPKYFPEDYITDQPERFIAAEIIREKALNSLDDEVPHGLAVEVLLQKKREGRELTDIEANIYCEKESHKGIIIGKGGDMLKRIGEAARADIERLLGTPVFLRLWVKVKKDWRDNNMLARSLGNFN